MKWVSVIAVVVWLRPILLLFWVAVMFAGCNDVKEVDVPIRGPSAGDTFLGGSGAQRLKLLASPSSRVEVAPGEQAKVTITAIVKNAFGQPMPDGTVVLWNASIGELDTLKTSTDDGIVNVTLTFPKGYRGCSWVTARSGDLRAMIKVCAGVTSQTLILEAADTDIGANDHVTLTATAMTDGKPDVGFQVTFEIVSGTDYAVLSASAAITDAAGKASIELEGQNTSAADHMVEIKASTQDGRSATIQILVEKP